MATLVATTTIGCDTGDDSYERFPDTATGSAALALTSNQETEPNDSPGDPGTRVIAMGDDNHGAFQPGDVADYWEFQLESRVHVNFFVGDIPSGSDYDMKVFRSTDWSSPVWSGTNSGSANELGMSIPLDSGTYVVKVYPHSGPRGDVSYRMRYASTAVSRGWEWVNAQVPYCGGSNGGADILCGGTCTRTGAADNPAWNPYRSDCSGFVSWAWGLPAPGRTTWTLPDVATAIHGSNLAPGDALIGAGHAVLFASWIDKGTGRARVLHEPECGQVAKAADVTLTVTSNSSAVQLWGDDYTAYRHDI